MYHGVFSVIDCGQSLNEGSGNESPGLFQRKTSSPWFIYEDDTWVKIQAKEVEAFTRRMSSVDNNIKFTREEANDNKMPF